MQRVGGPGKHRGRLFPRVCMFVCVSTRVNVCVFVQVCAHTCVHVGTWGEEGGGPAPHPLLPSGPELTRTFGGTR